MGTPLPPPAPPVSYRRLAASRLWIFAWLMICTLHGALVWRLFSPQFSWQPLLDDRPILSGRHPLHLYHGFLGARAFCETGRLCCYDPCFQAGYPKTPVFDSGSRPAELFMMLANGAYCPQAYKWGVAICLLLIPWLLLVGARGFHLDWGPACLTVTLGLIVWWGDPCRTAVQDGDIDILLGGVAAVAHVGLLIGFHRLPNWPTWIAALLTSALGLFTHPFLFLLLLPLLLLYYLSVGARHPFGWHVALAAIPALAVLFNSFWLFDWVYSWWLRLPLQLDADCVSHRTLPTLWNASLWGQPADRALCAILIGMAGVGVGLLNDDHQRTAARLWGLGSGGFFLLALGGMAWRPLGRLGTSHLLLPALWFAAYPATYTLLRGFALLQRCTRSRIGAILACLAILLTAAMPARSGIEDWVHGVLDSPPLAIGLSASQTELIQSIKQSTTTEARILWEQSTDPGHITYWTALLPLLTDRAFIGGLAADTCIEHSYPDLVNEVLAGQPIADWNDSELEAYCRRYNVGWAVLSSPAAIERFRAWKGARIIAPLHDDPPAYLFAMQPRSYVLKGSGRWLEADSRHIALSNVLPVAGTVVLSLHYQSGLQASPGRVQVEREPDAQDPIPFVRLRVPGHVARLTLTWDSR